MTTLEELYDTAVGNGINVVDAHFSATKKAACMYDEKSKLNGFKLIVLDKPSIETTAEEAVVLAEEIAHYETGALYLIDASYNTPLIRSNRRKYESLARSKALERLCPLKALQTCFENRMYNIHEIAEYLNITYDYVSSAINMYIEKNELDSNYQSEH